MVIKKIRFSMDFTKICDDLCELKDIDAMNNAYCIGGLLSWVVFFGSLLLGAVLWGTTYIPIPIFLSFVGFYFVFSYFVIKWSGGGIKRLPEHIGHHIIDKFHSQELANRLGKRHREIPESVIDLLYMFSAENLNHYVFSTDVACLMECMLGHVVNIELTEDGRHINVYDNMHQLLAVDLSCVNKTLGLNVEPDTIIVAQDLIYVVYSGDDAEVVEDFVYAD